MVKFSHIKLSKPGMALGDKAKKRLDSGRWPYGGRGRCGFRRESLAEMTTRAIANAIHEGHFFSANYCSTVNYGSEDDDLCYVTYLTRAIVKNHGNVGGGAYNDGKVSVDEQGRVVIKYAFNKTQHGQGDYDRMKAGKKGLLWGRLKGSHEYGFVGEVKALPESFIEHDIACKKTAGDDKGQSQPTIVLHLLDVAPANIAQVPL